MYEDMDLGSVFIIFFRIIAKCGHWVGFPIHLYSNCPLAHPPRDSQDLPVVQRDLNLKVIFLPAAGKNNESLHLDLHVSRIAFSVL